jgi:hypothetical protein
MYFNVFVVLGIMIYNSGAVQFIKKYRGLKFQFAIVLVEAYVFLCVHEYITSQLISSLTIVQFVVTLTTICKIQFSE